MLLSCVEYFSHYCPYLKSLIINSGSFVSTKTVDIPKGTMVTIKLSLPRDSVGLDSLHQYQSLSEIELFNSDQ